VVWDRKIWRFVIVLTRIGEDELVPKGGGLDYQTIARICISYIDGETNMCKV